MLAAAVAPLEPVARQVLPRGGLRVNVGHCSLQGRRPDNEDFAGAVTPEHDALEEKGVLLAVADGVGGHAHGREAAEYVVRGLLSDYYATPETWGVSKSLDAVLVASNRWLLSQARTAPESAGMATTLTAVTLRGARYYVAHVGDSRAYLWRDGQLTQLTEDHTWEHPELRNVLRRAMGLDSHFKADHTDGELVAGDRFLLVTDGVWGALPDREIAAVLATHTDPDDAAAALALAATRSGSMDNCTALVADAVAVPAGRWRDSLDALRRLPLPTRLRVGQEIDGLRVEALLHESRVTLLYRVARCDAQGDETLVLKTLRPEEDDPEAIAALVHEEWLARRVTAPGFPQVIGHPGRSHLYYLMTWHDGESLAARLARGHRFSPPEVVQLGMRILRGIGALHRLGIVHRDIKPDNVHLDTLGQVRILDLGVAASDGQDFREINNPGTPSYMAPELFAGRSADAWSDLYACGVSLYTLLTRKYPYGEIEPFQTPVFRQPAPPTRYRPDTPAWLEAVLLKACAREPEDRFETAEEFLLALERGANRPLTAPRPVPLLNRHPSLALKLIAGLSLIVNVVLILWVLR
ncbi:MAG: protein phosphatase 2C domain-containing protein [Burkholderiales bacterium]